MTETKTIKVDYLARVEGEGGLLITDDEATRAGIAALRRLPAP